MSKSFVNLPPAAVRFLIKDALEKLDAFDVRHKAEVRAELARRGRATVLGWLLSKVRGPLTDDQAIDLAKRADFWWLHLPQDYGCSTDRKLFVKLLAAAEAADAVVVQLHVEDHDLIEWWRKFEE